MQGTIAPPQTNLDWERVRAIYGSQITTVEGIIQSLEEAKHFQLTTGAIEILLIPIVEALEEGATYSAMDLLGSLRRIFDTMAQDPIEAEKGLATRSAFSVLKSMSLNICKIPPFCRK